MSPTRTVPGTDLPSFPRVSGDEPYGGWIQTIEFNVFPA